MTELEYPKNWSCTRLKNVALVNENSLSTSTHSNYVLNYLEISNVNNRGIISKNEIRELFFSDAPSRARRIVRNGDTVISSVRPNLQALAYIQHTPENLIASTGFYVVTPLQKLLDEKYTYYLLISDGSRQHLEAAAKGVGYPAVDDKDFVTLKFSIPSIEEQQRIASYLDKNCATIDKAIEAKQKQLEILDDLRKSIIHKAVTRGLDDSVELKDSNIDFFGMVPIDWKTTKFRYEISIRNGDFISDKLDENGLHPVVGGNGFMGMTNDFNVDEKVIAIGRVGAYCGNVHLITKQSWISDNALIVKSMHDLKYFVYVFIALDLNSEANKTAQPVITGTKIKNIRIAIPMREEQNKIAYFLDGKLSKLQHIKENIKQQISTLEKYRKSLIHECVTGKRRSVG